jgi:hypothetical protein
LYGVQKDITPNLEGSFRSVGFWAGSSLARASRPGPRRRFCYLSFVNWKPFWPIRGGDPTATMIQGRLAPAEARPASRQGGPSQLAQQPAQASQPAKARPASGPTSPAGQPRARGPLTPSRSPPAPLAEGQAKGKTLPTSPVGFKPLGQPRGTARRDSPGGQPRRKI